MRWVLRSKIHKATVTDANLNYVGSITIDEDLMDLVGLIAGEKVDIADNTNGARMQTYVLVGERGSGIICLNGASAHLINKGDEIIIMAYELSDTTIAAKKILVDKENKFVRFM